MTEETRSEQPDIPHKDLQVQWHKDWIHSLETGEPMREWQFMMQDDREWRRARKDCIYWEGNQKFRRKPRTVTYWHCVAFVDETTRRYLGGYTKEYTNGFVASLKAEYPAAKFTPIIETTVELGY